MKKVYLLFASMAIVGSSFAQNVPAKRIPTASNEDQHSILLLENNATNKTVGTAKTLNLNINRSNKAKGIVDTIFSHFVGTPTLYTATGGGYVAGHNNYGDLAKMQRFDGSFGINSTGTINKVILAVGAKEGSPTSVISVNIWDDNAGKPGNIIATMDVPFSDLDTSSANGLTTVTFANPVAIPSNKIFYAGISFTYSGSDAVGLVTTADGDFPQAITHTWEQWGDLSYHAFGDPTNWDLGIALAIFPVVELDPVVPPPTPTGVYYSQDFNGGIPSSYLIVDVDAQPVASAISALFPKAWNSGIASGSVSPDSSALSTSWYTPAGTSDDWMITDTIIIPDTATSVFLSWQAEAIDPDFPDGYEVYISNTTQSIAGCQANPVVFSIASENDVITERKMDISSFIGDTIFVGFRNNSTDMFILSIDDIKVYSPSAYDLSVKSTSVEVTGISQYTAIPSRHLTVVPSDVNVVVSNLGAAVPAAATIYAEIKNGTTVVYSDTLVVTTGLPAAGAESQFTMPKAFTIPSLAGQYNLSLTTTVSIVESEDVTNNSSTSNVASYNVTDTVYSRDNNATGTSNLSIGGGLTGHLGMVYDIKDIDTLTSVTAVLRGAKAGRKVSISVWSFNGTTPSTTALVTSKVYNASAVGTYNFVLSGGVVLTPGQYLVTINELDSGVTIATTTTIFTNNTVWIKSPGIAGGAWNPAEAFGANFARTFYLRPNFGNIVTVGLNNKKALDALVNVYPNPSSNGLFNIAISSNVAESYSIVVTDVMGREINAYHNLPNGEFNIDLSNEANGFYFIKVQSGDSISTQKVILNK